MSTATRIRNRLIFADDSLAETLRRRRWQRLLDHVPDFPKMRVLDLGGTTIFWTRAPIRPKSVTLINLNDPGAGQSWIRPITGDAGDAPDLVGDETFDLVFSNSLIEHLGGHHQRLRFSEVVRSMAPRYVVQTPYRFFPLEPHWLFPGMQFLPARARAWLAPRWPLGHTYGWPHGQAANEVMGIDLLSVTEMRTYFPDALIVWERFAGLPKSMTAIR